MRALSLTDCIWSFAPVSWDGECHCLRIVSGTGAKRIDKTPVHLPVTRRHGNLFPHQDPLSVIWDTTCERPYILPVFSFHIGNIFGVGFNKKKNALRKQHVGYKFECETFIQERRFPKLNSHTKLHKATVVVKAFSFLKQ